MIPVCLMLLKRVVYVTINVVKNLFIEISFDKFKEVIKYLIYNLVNKTHTQYKWHLIIRSIKSHRFNNEHEPSGPVHSCGSA